MDKSSTLQSVRETLSDLVPPSYEQELGHAERVEFASDRKIRDAKQAQLPVQSLANLDLGVLHHAGSAHLRPLRARLRLADCDVAGVVLPAPGSRA